MVNKNRLFYCNTKGCDDYVKVDYYNYDDIVIAKCQRCNKTLACFPKKDVPEELIKGEANEFDK